MDGLGNMDNKEVIYKDTIMDEILSVIDEENEISIDVIKSLIEKKLEISELPLFNVIDTKTQERITQIERYNIRTSRKVKLLVAKAKELRLTATSITNDSSVKFSRKTAYNNKLLLDYMNILIDEEEDYFNEKENERLQRQFNELEERYNNIVSKVLETKIMEMEIKYLKAQIKNLATSNQIQTTVIAENHKNLKKLNQLHLKNIK